MKNIIIFAIMATLLASCGHTEYNMPKTQKSLITQTLDSTVWSVSWTDNPVQLFEGEIILSIEKTTVLSSPKKENNFDGDVIEWWGGSEYQVTTISREFWEDESYRMYANEVLDQLLHGVATGDFMQFCLENELNLSYYRGVENAVILWVEEFRSYHN